ncbi:MAG: phenylacetic acid degradation bifunctional protein PaaZ [Rhodobacteraceae bacterium]|nr:phenylacetic acid degradation bifunctional protein PaaZ [Paracoccaceae bacterium]
MQQIHSFASGHWIAPDAIARPIYSAVTSAQIAQAGNALNTPAMLDFARNTGGPALRALTFHDRARRLKALALHLKAHKKPLYALSHTTGATHADSQIDIDGGITTMLVFASKGRRELPDAQVYLDGNIEQLSRNGSFMGQHICTPLLGAAVHINAYNFPVWGMLEKLAPTLLAGVPAIIKPATSTVHVAEAAFRIMVESGIFPEGAMQFIAGSSGDLLGHLGAQDTVAFTGSADTALMLRAAPNLLKNAVRFTAEQDSLNASILGPDATEGTPEFDLFITEAHREITTKAGQKCTAIRRILAPEALVAPVIEALTAKLEKTVIGDPAAPETTMGALVSEARRADVLARIKEIAKEATRVFGDDTPPMEKGAFMAPQLFHCTAPDSARAVHEVEAFGPVSTIMPYRDLPHAAALANRGGGSLVASVITHDPAVASQLAMDIAAHHGRLYFNDRDSMAESTGHGAPLPHLVHGGPGRAGGGEEMGGIRGVMHYMQRTAVQGSPRLLSAIGQTWLPGAPVTEAKKHPFRHHFEDLTLGESLLTDARKISLEDIEHFARFTGDTFYAHMDEEAAKANPFFPGRVAHGYLLLSFAAGLFVEPDPGPVLANTGLERLSFQQPVSPGDSLRARLTVMRKTKRNDDYGEVRWHVELSNQRGETVATYELLTMVARLPAHA